MLYCVDNERLAIYADSPQANYSCVIVMAMAKELCRARNKLAELQKGDMTNATPDAGRNQTDHSEHQTGT